MIYQYRYLALFHSQGIQQHQHNKESSIVCRKKADGARQTISVSLLRYIYLSASFKSILGTYQKRKKQVSEKWTKKQKNINSTICQKTTDCCLALNSGEQAKNRKKTCLPDASSKNYLKTTVFPYSPDKMNCIAMLIEVMSILPSCTKRDK